jgi:uncharacterized membrane protein
MLSHLQDWLALTLRWFHLIAGISWIGSSFYFMWLDSSLAAPEAPKPGVEGELWMVHSGGFYQVEKRKITPEQMPKTLHWFKWEAALTWMSGIVLLSVLYYMTGGVYLLDSRVSSITEGAASALGIGLLVVSWLAYDALWASPLGKKQPGLSTTICYAALIGIVYGLCHVLSGRAAFIHVGAMFGSIMVLNVWVRILPAQQRMIDATKEGRTPDYTLGQAAKRRSVHNSYMTFPVLFIMLSNHYPMTYAGAYNWLILLSLIVVGAAVRHAMIAKNGSGRWALAPAICLFTALVVLTAPFPSATYVTYADGPKVTFAQAHAVIQARCLACHSASPTDDVFKAAPNGIMFDSSERIKELADRIRFRAVESKTMPLANKTGMTEEERVTLGRWIDQGAKLQ